MFKSWRCLSSDSNGKGTCLNTYTRKHECIINKGFFHLLQFLLLATFFPVKELDDGVDFMEVCKFNYVRAGRVLVV